MGVEVAMLTGDSETGTKAVVEELGIDYCFAEVLPQYRDEQVSELQRQSRRVAMVWRSMRNCCAGRRSCRNVYGIPRQNARHPCLR